MPNKSSFCLVSCPGFGHRANDIVPHESCCMHTRFYSLNFFLTLTLSHFCFVSVVTWETNCLSFSWLLFAGHESLVFQIVICTTCHPQTTAAFTTCRKRLSILRFPCNFSQTRCNLKKKLSSSQYGSMEESPHFKSLDTFLLIGITPSSLVSGSGYS